MAKHCLVFLRFWAQELVISVYPVVTVASTLAFGIEREPYPVGEFGLRGKRCYCMSVHGEMVDSLNEMGAI